MPLRALLFDFDGLMLDTETAELVSWQELWAEHGQRFPAERYLREIGTVGGYGAMSELEQLAGPLDRTAAAARRSERKMALIELEELRPGVSEYLEEARVRGIATAIVSSSSRGWIDAHLERLERSGQFDAIVTGDHDASRGKPLPTLYLEALELLAVAPAEAVAFEDSPNGVTAATAAGVFTVGVPNGVTAGMSLDHADLLVGSLAELPFGALLALQETWGGGPDAAQASGASGAASTSATGPDPSASSGSSSA
jgi:HAD superfamily hydrolase (TIGR01509 family)